MHFRTSLLAAASAAFVSAQNNSLLAVLNSTSELSTLNSILANYTDVVNLLTSATNITIFAPSNSALDPLISSPAFAALSGMPDFVQSFLSYHAVNGTYNSSAFTTTPVFVPTYLNNTLYSNVTGGQRVEGRLNGQNVTVTSGSGQSANVTTADVAISNGIVHIIDNYLSIPANVSTTALDAGLTSLVGALVATNLSDTLDAASDVTIFAPTNAAFQDIASVLSNLTTDQAAAVLEYHVINGTVAYSSLLSNTTGLTALSGQGLNITIEDGAVFVNSARVIAANILISGGVVHVIDSVLNPNGTETPDAAVSTPVVAYSGASSGSVAPFTSGITASTTIVITTTAQVAAGQTPAPSGALSSASAAASSAKASSSSSGAATMPTVVGAMGVAALFGGAVMVANF